ncbi:glycoside hydrolase family 2 protein [Vallitalea okinawensis]|uniref:glycoside hydrolase family 2 protein n=1 Tax=Vallitalea okinawensis TaxID=2078660 RepID=UPI001478B041|nr:sugar-binding domain-containing protein [Vallitalea okinawensis]
MTSNNWNPIEENLMTRWAKDVDHSCPLPEYPRPQMIREDWMNLNGLWDYAILPKVENHVNQFDGKILVPYCIESALSGVKRALQPDEHLWYKRDFHLPREWEEKRILLHFGAIDWQATVAVNGKEVGSHTGGYLPFSFDITDFLGEGKNEMTVKVWDPTDTHWQQKGKQVLNPHSIFYTATSGIWQTVWMEAVPKSYIKNLKMTPDIDAEKLHLETTVIGHSDLFIRGTVLKQGKEVITEIQSVGQEMSLSIINPMLWSPNQPFLYDLRVELVSGNQVIDSVDSYFGMRKFSLMEDEEGTKRLALNNKILFQNGPLDQGYWPDGIYTAPTDEALRFDIEETKRLGFNMTRKHIKVEPARWYYWCDKIGLIVWQDMINGGKLAFDKLIPEKLQSGQLDIPMEIMQKMVSGQEMDTSEMMVIMHAVVNSVDDDTSKKWYDYVNRNEEARHQFEAELKELVDTLYNVPSLGMWIPFNESWGQFDSRRVGDWLSSYDPTRYVDYHCGWIDTKGGQLQTEHIYCQPLAMPEVKNNRAMIVSEYGGYTYQPKGHIWEDEFFSYSHYETLEDFEKAYVSLIEEQVKPLKEQGCCGVVYTQITDVEREINGFLSYDRQVLKVNPDRINKIHQTLYK